MIAGDTVVLDELCSDDLIYTHSKADHDDKRSYLHKVGSRYFTYLEITHPADRILVTKSDISIRLGILWRTRVCEFGGMHKQTNIQLSHAYRRELEAVAANRNSPKSTSGERRLCL